MKIVLFGTVFLMLLFVAGLKPVTGENQTIKNAEDFLTVSLLEDNIRKQREENYKLEQELARLQAK